MAKECNCQQIHVSYKEFQQLSPYVQGYVVYMQAEHYGSELKNRQSNPYRKSTPAWEQFNNGNMRAMLEAQDSEE